MLLYKRSNKIQPNIRIKQNYKTLINVTAPRYLLTTYHVPNINKHIFHLDKSPCRYIILVNQNKGVNIEIELLYNCMAVFRLTLIFNSNQ